MPDVLPDDQAPARLSAPASDRLRIVIGHAADGTPVRLDLKEAVDGGMGPHGLIAGDGTAGLLRTTLLGLAAAHTADEVTFVLLDAGTAAFDGLDRLPHTAVSLDASRPDLVPRLIEVLEGESSRRKRLLVAAGCTSHSGYLRKTANQPPMPALLLLCHDLPALLTAHPGLLDTLRRLGWLGRARGIHLLLTVPAGPNPHVPADPELHGLAGYLSYRIALPHAPGFVLDSPTTNAITPGHGLLRLGTDQALPFTLATATPAGTALDHLGSGRPPTHRIWLPPLDEAPALDELAGPVVSDPDHGLVFADRTLHGALQVPVAVLDKPREHRRDTVWLPIAGHVAVVGGHGSGKSTILRTIIAALALSHTAPAVRVLVPESLDTVHRQLPVVHGVLGPTTADDALRNDLYAALDLPRGDTVVIIDDWPEFWATRPAWHELLLDIARRGSGRGVHLIVTAGRWSDFDPRVTDHFGSRLELRLTDPAESAISPGAAATIPPTRPGRGIVPAPGHPGRALHFVATRPELATVPHAALLAALATDHCAECGFTYRTVAPADLPARLRTAGASFAAALLASPDLRRRPEPDVWSPLEYTCHVRDVLQVQRERLLLALSCDNPDFPPMGRDERVVTDAYNAQDPHTVLTALDRAAEALAAAFAALPPSGFERPGTYPWPTPTTRTMLWLGRHTVHELVHHLYDITRRTAA
ncbi:hypothetical protein GCM10010168_29420 [Actinoplanes ianthinogenes]|uniref:FtsK domain-containing protein n=1 Tax=Actinoplanes ianthinogenes TaxID=122358 RepID=A0ABM7LLJ6_9ACTN|nr:FtsK/SpoIIIE domain-containing protein [Actinoplanes ianthinogenes]BCJ40084.1 hypothetical protein Aiant_07410 [Actinoplanes ianthinogenes]GGR10166.1 hypothetical protein GCM10010168_29420 [Actinoplanes ianthinogenes]